MEQLSMAPGVTRLQLTIQIHHDYAVVNAWISVLQGPSTEHLEHYSDHGCGDSTPERAVELVNMGAVALRWALLEAIEPFPATYLELAQVLRTVLHRHV